MRARHLATALGLLGIGWLLVACGGQEPATEAPTGSVSNYEEAERAGLSWEDRVAAYRKERDAVLADPNVGEATREAALTVLRADHFDPSEYAKVEAMDAQDMGGP